jgi:hypothetical protein
MRFALVLLVAVSGCATRPPIEPATACRIVQDNLTSLDRSSPKDLVGLSYGTPVYGDAQNALAQQRAMTATFVIAGAALAGGLVTGLSTSPGSDEAARGALYGLAGSAIALGVIALVLEFTLPRQLDRVRASLRAYAGRCGP